MITFEYRTMIIGGTEPVVELERQLNALGANGFRLTMKLPMVPSEPDTEPVRLLFIKENGNTPTTSSSGGGGGYGGGAERKSSPGDGKIIDGHVCPECGATLKQRTGYRGVFWGCSEYPKCRGTMDPATAGQGTLTGAAVKRAKPDAVDTPPDDENLPF